MSKYQYVLGAPCPACLISRLVMDVEGKVVNPFELVCERILRSYEEAEQKWGS